MSRCLAVNMKWCHTYKYWNADLNLLGSIPPLQEVTVSSYTCMTRTNVVRRNINRPYFILDSELTAERLTGNARAEVFCVHGCLNPWSAALLTGFEILLQGLLFYSTHHSSHDCVCTSDCNTMNVFKERLSLLVPFPGSKRLVWIILNLFSKFLHTSTVGPRFKVITYKCFVSSVVSRTRHMVPFNICMRQIRLQLIPL